MVISMRHTPPRLRGRAGLRALDGASLMDTITSAVTSSLSEAANDKGVKAQLAKAAISGITGIAPVVDTSDPKVTVVRLTPRHGAFLDAMVTNAMTPSPPPAPGAKPSPPSNFKIDVMPAVTPVLLKYVLPASLVLIAVGYFVGRKTR